MDETSQQLRLLTWVCVGLIDEVFKVFLTVDVAPLAARFAVHSSRTCSRIQKCRLSLADLLQRRFGQDASDIVKGLAGEELYMIMFIANGYDAPEQLELPAPPHT